MRNRLLHFLLALTLLSAVPLCAEDTIGKALIRDVTSVEGVRDNPIIGYGVVVGLKNSGDKQQTLFTNQTLANILQRVGVQTSPAAIIVKNVAAVFVTAVLPPFARPGTRLDVTVASAGDARSLEGGLLLLTPLYGADGQVYATAQGTLVLGGYSEGGGSNSKQVNHPTAGRVPGGGLVERDSSLDLRNLEKVSLLLNDPNFQGAEEVASAIDREFEKPIASVVDSRRIDVRLAGSESKDIPALLARVEDLNVVVYHRARVVVNERTGTIVMGKDVHLGAVSILHGNLSIEVTTEFAVSQPNPLSQGGKTEVVPGKTIKAEESPARRIELSEGATVEQLVNGLQKIGATSRDVIAILQAIKAAGALEADLEVI
ncbi:MAG: flagellar basal body P-ring protein FlgI [Terriglobales bacterium]